MGSGNYWVPWQARDALIAFSNLKADEIGVLMQIVNLIYIYEKPIDNDPKYIGKISNKRPSLCKPIIDVLIEKNHIYLTDDGKISKKRCEREIKTIRKKRRNRSESGKKGAETRWGNEQNQVDSNGDPISSDMAKTSTNSSQNHITNTDGQVAFQESGGDIVPLNRQYNIEHYLEDIDIVVAKKFAPKWDIYHLYREYNKRINQGTHAPPTHPVKAFIAWVKKRTQCKPPP